MRCVLAADDECRIDRQPRELAERAGELGGLVVAAREQPDAVERHRHQHGVGPPELVAGLRHQPRAEAGEFGPVAVFELAHEGAGDVVVNDRGAGPLEGRRIGDGFGRPRVGSERRLERQAQHRAEWRGDGAERAEAGAAECIGGRDGGVTGEADRRIELVEQRCAQPAQGPHDARFDNRRPRLHKAILPSPGRSSQCPTSRSRQKSSTAN